MGGKWKYYTSMHSIPPYTIKSKHVCSKYFKRQTTTLESCLKERLANLYFYILVYITQTWKNENYIGYIILTIVKHMANDKILQCLSLQFSFFSFYSCNKTYVSIDCYFVLWCTSKWNVIVLAGNTSGVSKFSLDWFNYTGFLGDVYVLHSIMFCLETKMP